MTFKGVSINKADIITFIKKNNGAEIAAVQQRFNIAYKDAKVIIDELLSKGDLVYAEGVRYNYVNRQLNFDWC